jgi:hypothetical protein
MHDFLHSTVCVRFHFKKSNVNFKKKTTNINIVLCTLKIRKDFVNPICLCRKQHHPAASGGSGHPRAGPGQPRPRSSTQPFHPHLALGWPLQPPYPLSYRPLSGLLALPPCKERGHSLFGDLLFTEKLSLA